MLRKLLLLMLVLITPAIIYLIYHWYATQPIRIATAAVSSPKSIQELPKKNQEILQYIELQGKTLAPTYQEVVCTDYVINVLSNFYNLSPQEKRGIQIITEENLHDLIESDAAVINGINGIRQRHSCDQRTSAAGRFCAILECDGHGVLRALWCDKIN